MEFSVVLIAKNEEDSLPRLLRSIKQVKDIVLVDTGSTDKTVEIARKAGVKVFEEGYRFQEVVTKQISNAANIDAEWNKEEKILEEGEKAFNYSSARNYAACLAKNKMIFMPDCDEEVTWDFEKLKKEIEGVDRLEYDFVFAHDDAGKPLIQFIHSKFYNREKFRWVRNIHEVLTGEGKTKYVPPAIIKLDHWQNTSQNRDHYLKGLAIDNVTNEYSDRNMHYYARELMYRDRPKTAIAKFERHIEKPGWVIEQAQSAHYIGDCQRMLGDDDSALEAYYRAIRMFPGKRESYNAIGGIYLERKMWHEAAAMFVACLEIPEPNFYSTFGPMYREIPHNNLAIALWQKGEEEKAFGHLQKVLEYDPDNLQALSNIKYSIPTPKVSIVIPTLGRPKKLKRLIEKIKEHAVYPDYEIIVVHDGEDIVPYEGVTSLKNDTRLGVPITLKRGVETSSGDLVMYLGNDCVPLSGFLIKAVYKMWQAYGEEMDGLVGLNDMYWHGEFATHWLASKKLLPMLDGDFFYVGYHHCGCDNELTERCRKVDRYVWAEHAKVYHDHPVQTGFNIKDQDEVYAIAYNQEKVAEDKALLHKRAKELGFELRENFERPVEKK